MHTITGIGKTAHVTLLLLALALLGSCGQQSASENADETEPVPKVKATVISRRDLESFDKIPATVIYFDKSDLTAPVTGFLTKVNVQSGDVVTGRSIVV